MTHRILSRPGHDIGPDLHRVDRHRLVERLILEWRTFHGALPELDPTRINRAPGPCAGACSTISAVSSTPTTCPEEARTAKSWMPHLARIESPVTPSLG